MKINSHLRYFFLDAEYQMNSRETTDLGTTCTMNVKPPTLWVVICGLLVVILAIMCMVGVFNLRLVHLV